MSVKIIKGLKIWKNMHFTWNDLELMNLKNLLFLILVLSKQSFNIFSHYYNPVQYEDIQFKRNTL